MAVTSVAEQVADWPEEKRRRFYARLEDEEARRIAFDWHFWARENQLPPEGDWTTWLILAGRGFGKTRTGAEWVRANIDRFRLWAFVAPISADARDVMVEGESGIMRVFPPDQRPFYEPSKRRVTFQNGAIATLFSSEEPDRLRGPQFHAAWADEAAAWKYREDTWDMLQFGLRLGMHPRQIVTTTPKPVKLVRLLLEGIETGEVAVTSGSTHENRSNLAPSFFRSVIRRYEGTLLGQQELYAKVLDEFPGAFWTREMIEEHRASEVKLEDFTRIVVAVDPAATAGEESDQTGIAVAGKHSDGGYYLLACEGVRLSPHGWASRVLDAYDRWGADKIVAEVNNGGEMVEATLRHERTDLPISVIHASRGKTVRAEPVAALYEQGRVHHLGSLDALEDQMVAFPVATDLDDLVDAMVYAVTELSQGFVWNTSVFPDPAELGQENPWAINTR